MKNNLNFYRPINNLSLLNRAKEIYSSLKLISDCIVVRGWYYLDSSPFDINDSNNIIAKILKDFSDNIQRFTIAKTVDYNAIPFASSIYAVFCSDRFDDGPIIRIIISNKELEFVIVKYKELLASDEQVEKLIQYLESIQGFILDRDF
nr:hypothetical protein [uncultured Mucilaginibacter sp.]